MAAAARVAASDGAGRWAGAMAAPGAPAPDADIGASRLMPASLVPRIIFSPFTSAMISARLGPSDAVSRMRIRLDRWCFLRRHRK